MTAYPSAIPESTAAEQRAHEPSMEEILASIRKIISDDQVFPLSSRPEGAALDFRQPDVQQAGLREPAPALEPDRLRQPANPARPPLDFSGAFVSAPPVRPLRSDARPAPDMQRSVAEAPRPSADVREIAPRPASAPAPRLVANDEPPLVSDQVDMAVHASFQALNVARSMPSPQTFESVARDLLRPMLKEWLDDNLPSLVERLVRAEIERVARSR